MSRTLFLAFALVAACAATRFADRGATEESIFRAGYEYIYRYESQVFSGIRTVSNQVSGLKIHSMVKVQFTRDQGVLIKMGQLSIFKVNHQVEQFQNMEIVPDSELTKLTGEEEHFLVEELEKPIRFRFDEGEVRDIKSLPGDKYWSINIKKGLISLFQLKISGKSTWSMDDSNPESSSYSSNFVSQRNTGSNRFQTFNPVANRRISTSKLENAFKVMELDVNGECETKYVINTDTSAYDEPSHVSQMVVTKVKNFDRCLSKNSYEEGLFAHLPHFQSERKLVQPSFEAEYILTGDRHHFLIKKATVAAKYFFRPYGQDGGQMSTHISQKLYLDSTQELRNQISSENFVAEMHGLKMEIPRSSFVPSNSVSSNEQEWQDIVDNKLNKVISAIYPVMQEIATGELFQLQLILRQIPRRQIVSIVKFYERQGHEEFNKKREILLDILPTCIYPETGKALLDLIKDGTIQGLRARLSIDAMVLTIKPTPEITKYLMSFYREAESFERTNPHLRQTILLGVGVLGNKMINHERRVTKPIPELSNAVEEISQEFISLLSQASSDYEKILVLKAMGNMGAKEFITPLKTIIEERSLSKYIRFEAVIAFKKLAKPFDKLVHPILLSVIFNQKENSRVRIAGIMVLKNSIPTYTTLQLLAHSIQNEPSTQVKSFIYTSLISLTKLQSPIPEIQQTVRDARKVLKTMRAVPVGVFDSKDYVADFFSESSDMGMKWNGEYLKSDKTGLPHSFFHTLHSTIFGNRLKLAKFGVEGEMVTSIVRRLIGPYGLLKNIFKNKASFYDLFKPHSGPEATFDFQDFFNQKNFRPSEDQEMHGQVFAELFGYEMFYRKFDKESAESYMNYAKRYVPELINKLRQGINFNTLKTLSIACNSIVLPTPMGIPVSLNFSTNAIFKLDGYVKATSLPSFADFVRQRPFMTKKIEIEADLKPSWTMEVYGGLGVDLNWLRSGVALKGNFFGKFPVKGMLVVNPADSKLTVRFEPPTEDIRAFNAKVEPITYVYYTSSASNLYSLKKDVRSIKAAEIVAVEKYEKNYACQVTGMDWYLKAQWTKCVHTWCPYYPLSGKQEFLFGYRSPSATPKEIVVQIKKFSQDMFNEHENQEVGSTTDSYQGNYRTSGRYNSDETSEDEYYRQFDHVEVDSLISSPRKVEVFVEVNLNGYRLTKTLKGKFTWVAEHNYLEHQLNAQFVAVQNNDMEQFMFKFNSVWKCPLIFTQEYEAEYNSNENIAKIDFYWGRNGFNEKTIKCKLFELEESKWTEEFHAENVGYNYHYEHAGVSPQVFRYGFEAVFLQMTPVWQKYLTKVHDFFKYGLYNYLKVGLPENIPENKFVIYAQYFATFEKLSVVMKTTHETNYLLDVPVYYPMAQFYRPNLHDLNPSYVYRNFSNAQFDIERFDHPSYDSYHNYKQYKPSLQGECKIYSDKLMTFDGTPIMLPVYNEETSGSRCNILFARDCSERSTFAVTGSIRNNYWTVKLNIPSYRIEFIPEVSGDRMRIKVNGEDFRVRQNSPVMLYQEHRNPSSELLVTITKIGDGVLVKLHELGVTISFEERNKLKIKVSPVSMLQGRLCGLCGNNNYDLGDDLTTFEGKLTGSRAFVADNVMRSDQCDVNDYRQHLNIRHAGYCKLSKTIMKEKMEDDEEKTCFSKNTVPQCRRHCSAESVSSRTVRFVCLPTESVAAQRFVSKYQSGYTDLTTDLINLTTSYEEVFQVPENCVTTY